MKKILLSLTLLIIFSFFIPSKQQPKVGVQFWAFHKFTFTEAVEKAASLGLTYAEAYPGQTVSATIKKPFNYTLSAEERSIVKKLLIQKNISIVALGVIDRYYYTHQNLEAYFAFAKDMNIALITAEPETADLDLFNSLAEKYKVKVAIHDHPKPSSHYWHPDSVLAAVKGRKNLGACADIGHWARNGLVVTDCLKKLKGKVWGLHVKDVDLFDNVAAKDVLPGKGVCNLQEVFKILKQQKFNGLLSIEYEESPEDNMKQLAAYKNYIEAAIKK